MASARAPWQRVTRAEMPALWREQMEAARHLPVETLAMIRARMGVAPNAGIVFDVVLELPDFPISRQWQAWYSSLDATLEPDLVSVVVTAQTHWADRPLERAASLRSLLFEGKPTLCWMASWRPAALEGDGAF